MAQVTVTIPDTQVVRVREAFAAEAGVATADFGVPEFKAALVAWIKAVVRNHETTRDLNALHDAYKAQQAAYVPPTDIDAT